MISKTDSINLIIEVQAMTKAGINKFKCPAKKDIDDYELEEIISIIPEPISVTIRNFQINPRLWKELKDFESS